MRRSIVGLLLGLGVWCAAQAEPVKPNHHIIWVHGLGGVPEDSGFFSEAFLAKTQNASENFIFHFFVYDTKNDVLTIDPFADQLDQYIHKELDPVLKPGDHWSIAAHSQGGVVSLYYLMKNYLLPQNRGLFSQMDSFVTMGTPFWGSKVAWLAHLLKEDMGSVLWLKKYGLAQLAGISVGSNLQFRTFDMLTDPNKSKILKRITRDIRVLNIGGSFRPSEIMPGLFPSDLLIEEDLATPIYSSHLNFNSYKESPTATNALDVKPESFASSDFDYEFVTVDAIHMRTISGFLDEKYPFLNTVNWPTIIYTPPECVKIDLDQCSNHTIKVVVNHFLHNRADGNKQTYFQYGVTVRVRSKQTGFDPKKVAVKVLTPGRFMQLDPKLDSQSYRLHIWGPYSQDQSVSQMQLQVTAAGFKTRNVTLPVQPTRSTLVDLWLTQLDEN